MLSLIFIFAPPAFVFTLYFTPEVLEFAFQSQRAYFGLEIRLQGINCLEAD